MNKKEFIVWASQLQSQYAPSPDVLSKVSQVDLVAIVGPTGVGKTTIIEELNIPFVLSDVSREPRPGEKDNKSYHFRTDYEKMAQEIKEGKFVQFLVSPTGEFYGTRAEAYPDSGACSMAVVAQAMPHFEQIGFRSVTKLYIMPPSYVEWMRRIGGVRTKDLLGRISEAKGSITIGMSDDSYNFILNDVLDFALEDIRVILRGDEPDQHRAQLARGTADVLLEKIGDSQDG